MWDIVPHWYTKIGEKSERISQLEKRKENVRENVKIYTESLNTYCLINCK